MAASKDRRGALVASTTLNGIDFVEIAAPDEKTLRAHFVNPVTVLGSITAVRITGGETIPTLDQTLEAVGTRAGVFIEIKARRIENDVARCLRRHFRGYDNYAVHAFDHRIVKRMLELIPTVRTGILQVSYPIDSCAAMRAAGAGDLWQHVDFIDSRLVADIHSCGGRVIAWTANSERQWQDLSALGVDGVCTDHVDAYVRWRSDVAGA